MERQSARRYRRWEVPSRKRVREPRDRVSRFPPDSRVPGWSSKHEVFASTPSPIVTMLTSHSLAIAAAVGLLSGAHAAIWGMYKDSVYEGFGARCFVRSIIVGAVAAVAIQMSIDLPLPAPAAIVVLFGLAYAAERGIIEVWKTFIREQDQSKFFIPMAFCVGGVPVAKRGVRLAAGAAYVSVVLLCLLAVAQLDPGAVGSPSPSASGLVGLTVGIIIAIGGAWKDAPKEGFEPLKFFRSPLVAAAFALALSSLCESYLQIAVASIGYERASVETYKTLFTRGKAPGKFTGKPELYPEMRTHRGRAVPVFLGIWVVVLVSTAIALGERL